MRAFPILLAVLFARTLLLAGDWPQWRGPERNGVSAERIALDWPAEGPRVVWSRSVGTGFSSVAVCDGRAFTMGNSQDRDTIWCLHARTGAEIWRHSYPAKLGPQYYEGGPGATPTVDGRHVLTISKWGDVLCLSAAKGAVVWRCDLREHGFKPNRWGFAGSPLVWHNLVILNAGSAGVALERQTGRIVWSNGTNAAGYASPVLFRAGGKEMVLIFAAKDLVALDPKTGRQLWRFPWKTEWDTNNTDPLVHRGRILISSFTRGCALLSLENGRPEVVYDNKSLFNHLSPGVLLGDYLYTFTGEAKHDTEFCCFDLPGGALRWVRKDPTYGSLIAAQGCLIVLGDKGDLFLYHAETSANRQSAGLPVPDRAPIARAKILSGTCWTPPALAHGLLYARNAKGDLRCLDLRPPE